MQRGHMFIFILLSLCIVHTYANETDLCMDGTLLFREDFGGNDPNDPDVSMASVPGMSSQYYNSGNSLGSGHYTIRKEGWQNGIQWHRQDDHTYPDDKTRGYLLEIDGIGGSVPFYSKTIEGLCAGSKLTFSVYVVNVHYAGQIYPYLIDRGYVYPRLKFVLKNPGTGEVLASKSTGDIMPDMRYATPEAWKEARDNNLSAEWQLVGTNFTVPAGVESIQMFIYNDVEQNGNGNDFALDDIEIRLCAPSVTIAAPDTVCGYFPCELDARFKNNGTFQEPLQYKWWHSSDSLTWTELPGSSASYQIEPEMADSGWYKVAVSSAGNIESVNCRAMSEPVKLNVKYCAPPPLECPDGQLLYLKTGIGFWSEYNETLTGLCPGSKISVSALISYQRYQPIQIALIDQRMLTILVRYATSFDEEGPETISYNGRKWHRLGVNFTIPDGMNDITFRISNGYNAFIDSLEVHLCTPPVTIIAPDTVCVNTKNILTAQYENDGSLAEPLEYQWYFSADSLTWEPLNEGNSSELKLKAKPKHTGWYRVAVAGAGNINNEKCRAMSAPHKFFVIEDCPPILCPEGLLLMHRGYSSSVSFCDTTIEEICSPLDLSLIVNLPPDHPETRLIFRLLDPSTGNELSAYDTGDIPSDSLQVGTTFMIPNGVSSLRWVISNNKAGFIGQSFAIANTEILLCLEPISILAAGPACRKKPFTMQAEYENYGILRQPEYQWYFSEDSAGWYEEIDTATTQTLTIPEVHKSHEGWYRAAVSEQGRMAYPHCRSISEPFHLLTQYCNTAVEQHLDTTACDTLLEYHLTWRGHEWPTVGTLTDTLRDTDSDDSVYVHLMLHTKICCPDILTFHTDTAICDTLLPFVWQTEDFRQEYTAITTDEIDVPHTHWTNCTGRTYYLNLDIYHCCPEIVTVDLDSAVCDTLLPFTWVVDGHTFVFQRPEMQELEIQHQKWENCTGTIYTLVLDTFHCERLYPIVVNKYNWQLLLDNVALRRFFPDRRCLAFQWYKNGEAIAGATEDDYAEQNELCGLYQLCVRLDEAVDNHDEYIWSNILEIGEPAVPLPITQRTYNSSGIQVEADHMTRGVYFILYQQGEKFWAEKRLVP